MKEPGQICRDRTRKRFTIAIVLGPSQRGGKLRVCRWRKTDEDTGGHWSAPCALFEHLLMPLPADFDLTTRHGQVVAAAKRSVVDGKVRWLIGPASWPASFGGRLTEVHYVGTVRP